MPVTVRTTSRGSIELKVTNTTGALDERRNAPRYESLDRKQTAR